MKFKKNNVCCLLDSLRKLLKSLSPFKETQIYNKMALCSDGSPSDQPETDRTRLSVVSSPRWLNVCIQEQPQQ